MIGPATIAPAMIAPSRRLVLGGCCSCAALALAGCAAPAGRSEAGYRPAAASDEGGLWHQMERAENDLKRSRSVVRDPAANAYVNEIMARIAGDRRSECRLYIVHTPYFNANMAPNGMMQVWTGLLLRAQNEAQLAAVLGHEFGHYIQRHSLNRFRDAKTKSDIGTFLGLGLGAAGMGSVASLANLALVASMFAFTRDQEREADAIGLELMTKAGYEPLEASRVWEQIIAEQKADTRREEPSLFFSTHPAPEERVATLRAAAQKIPGADAYAERYRARMRNIRGMLLQDELRLRHYDTTLVVLDQLKAGAEDGELAFYSGEVYRLRNEAGDAGRAREAYARAVLYPDCPPETHRAIGLVELKAGDRAAAETAFQRYLDLRPGAGDREMIRSLMRRA